MIFTKMQLNGNDFVFINSLSSKIKIYQNLIKEICDRRFGVGADGVVVLSMSEKADCKIEIYNSDGSKAKICGNALLLLGRYLFELENFELENLGFQNLSSKNFESKKFDNTKLDSIKIDSIRIETDAGIKEIYLDTEYDEIKSVFVNMGKVSQINQKFDFKKSDKNFESKKFEFKFEDLNCLMVGNGNKHLVFTVKNIDDINIKDIMKDKDVLKIGKEYNIEFMQMLDKNKVRIKIFERGVGETLSCGSGACACAFVAAQTKFLQTDFFEKYEDKNKYKNRYDKERELEKKADVDREFDVGGETDKNLDKNLDKEQEFVVRSKGGEHRVKLLKNFDIVIFGKPELVFSGCLKM